MPYLNEDEPLPIPEGVALKREWFIGAYVTRETKLALKHEAAREGRSLSQQLTRILMERYNINGETNPAIIK